MASKATSGLLSIVSGLKARQGFTSNGSTGTSSSGGGGTAPSSGTSTVEVKYYKSDGTPVYGNVNESTVVPAGATAASGSNISVSQPKPIEPPTMDTNAAISKKTSFGSIGSFNTLNPNVNTSQISNVKPREGFSSAYGTTQKRELSAFETQIRPEYRQADSLSNYFRTGIISQADATDVKAKKDRFTESIRLRDEERRRAIQNASKAGKSFSTVTTLTPEMQRRTEGAREREKNQLSFGGFGEGLVSGFTLSQRGGYLAREGTFSQKAGSIAGILGSIYSVSRVNKAPAAVASTTSKAGTLGTKLLQPLARSTAGKSTIGLSSRITAPIGRVITSPAVVKTAQVIGKAKTISGVPLGLNVGKSILIGGTVVQSVKYGSALTASKEQRNVILDNDFKKFYSEGVKAQQAEASKSGVKIPFTNQKLSVGGIRSELTLGFASKSEREAFRLGVSQAAKRSGKTEDEIENIVFAAERQRKANIAGETLGLLSVGIMGERIGQRYVTNKFAQQAAKGITIPAKGAGLALAKIVFNPIGKAGIAEGAASIITQNIAREEPIKLKNVAIGAGAGYLSAGIIGSGIVGLSANKPTLSKIGQGLAYLTDPYEFPSDFLERKISRGVARATGKKVINPVVAVVNPAAVPAFTLTTSTDSNLPSVRKARARGLFSVGSFTSINTKTKTPINVNTNLFGTDISVRKSPITPSDVIPSRISTPADVPVTPNIPVNTNTNTPVNNNIITDSFTNIESPINTNVNTPVSTNIFTTVPVVTPIMRLPPPIPPIFPFGTGGGVGTKKVKKKKYVNELNQALKLFSNEFAGFNPLLPKQKVSRKKTKRRKR